MGDAGSDDGVLNRISETMKCLTNDEKGSIDKEILESVLQQVLKDRPTVTTEVIRNVLDEAPRNSEGSIQLTDFLRWIYDSREADGGLPRVEGGLTEGSWIVARLANANPAQYSYARVEAVSPLRARDTSGRVIQLEDILWAGAAKDDGWLAPFDEDWKQAGAPIILRLLANDEWVSARVAGPGASKEGNGDIYLPLEGVEGLAGVKVEEEVGMLFTPHRDCQDTFGTLEPARGGPLVSHLSGAFVREDPSKGKIRQRWVLAARKEAQYPMRCVWVHARVKELALGEFVRRCHEKRSQCTAAPRPEVVMLLGPPAAGKSSIQRLPPEEVPEDLRATASALKDREEVNNDNLTDCMPGFEMEFKRALGLEDTCVTDIKEQGTPWSKVRRTARRANTQEKLKAAAEAALQDNRRIDWAMQWLTYAMFHHGPIRDSVAWDVIKVTVVDAADLSVYYSSVMAGKSISRTMKIVDLAQSLAQPVPHKPLRIVGFWPYASQEARNLRQKKRHAAELEQQKLLGGNVDANLVNLHFHAQQAESNILKMLDCLNSGVQPDDEDGEKVAAKSRIDHFLVIDNDGPKPRVLFDWAEVDNGSREAELAEDMQVAARMLLEAADKSPQWFSMCTSLYQIAKCFLPKDDAMLLAVGEKHAMNKEGAGDTDISDVELLLPLLAEVDEAIFSRLHAETTALSTRQIRGTSARPITPRGLAFLQSISDIDAKLLQGYVSELRKFCVVRSLEKIREDSDDSSSSSGSDSDTF